MDKVKYIKVNAADRLPEKSGTYYSEIGEVFFAQSSGKFEHNYEAYNVFPEFWLSPVPDREEEMREVIQTYVSEFDEFNFSAENYKKAKQLLNELKTN